MKLFSALKDKIIRKKKIDPEKSEFFSNLAKTRWEKQKQTIQEKKQGDDQMEISDLSKSIKAAQQVAQATGMIKPELEDPTGELLEEEEPWWNFALKELVKAYAPTLPRALPANQLMKMLKIVPGQTDLTKFIPAQGFGEHSSTNEIQQEETAVPSTSADPPVIDHTKPQDQPEAAAPALTDDQARGVAADLKRKIPGKIQQPLLDFFVF